MCHLFCRASTCRQRLVPAIVTFHFLQMKQRMFPRWGIDSLHRGWIVFFFLGGDGSMSWASFSVPCKARQVYRVRSPNGRLARGSIVCCSSVSSAEVWNPVALNPAEIPKLRQRHASSLVVRKVVGPNSMTDQKVWKIQRAWGYKELTHDEGHLLANDICVRTHLTN